MGTPIDDLVDLLEARRLGSQVGHPLEGALAGQASVWLIGRDTHGGTQRIELLDRDVAFALIKTDGLDDVGRERVTREAQAMGRLGAHPHIVSIFDLGEHDGQPFVVTELMGGGDVEGTDRRDIAQRLAQ